MAIVIISKNIDYIYASFKLTQIGQYAAARTIFRNIYEGWCWVVYTEAVVWYR